MPILPNRFRRFASYAALAVIGVTLFESPADYYDSGTSTQRRTAVMAETDPAADTLEDSTMSGKTKPWHFFKKSDGNIEEAKNNHQNNDWADYDCLKPLSKPILGTHDLSRILNMGMPKCGSTSLFEIFHSSTNPNITTSHWTCPINVKDVMVKTRYFCGLCMHHTAMNYNPNATLLSSCGDYTVYTQMDFTYGSLCVFPQMDYMDMLYQDSPNATWILPFRNTKNWLRSVASWKDMAHRLDTICGWSEFQGMKSDEVYEDSISSRERQMKVDQLICNHVKKVRKFVKDHPTLSLVEFDIEDHNAGEFLASVFPIVKASDWIHANES